jgi:Ca2+-binding RTX toxin-like protein
MYNSKRSWNRFVPITMLILAAVSTSQLSSMIVSNGNMADSVYAQISPPSPPPASACIGTGNSDSRIIGTPGPDTIIGTDGHNIISGLGGDDSINGCGNVDSISGNAGNDGIAGGPARDL